MSNMPLSMFQSGDYDKQNLISFMFDRNEFQSQFIKSIDAQETRQDGKRQDALSFVNSEHFDRVTVNNFVAR